MAKPEVMEHEEVELFSRRLISATWKLVLGSFLLHVRRERERERAQPAWPSVCVCVCVCVSLSLASWMAICDCAFASLSAGVHDPLLLSFAQCASFFWRVTLSAS